MTVTEAVKLSGLTPSADYTGWSVPTMCGSTAAH